MEKLNYINCTSPNCGKRFLQTDDKITTCEECTPKIKLDKEVQSIIEDLIGGITDKG